MKPDHIHSIFQISDWVALSSLTVAAIAVAFAAYEFYRREKWRKKHTLASFMESMLNKQSNISAFDLIDINGGWIDLFPRYDDMELIFEETKIKKFQKVNFDEVAQSLTTNEDKAHNLNVKLFHIRALIDRLLIDFENLNLFVKSNLYDIDDVTNFIRYYLRLISGNDPEIGQAPHIMALKRYILFYGFDEARFLIKSVYPDSFDEIEEELGKVPMVATYD